MWGSVFVLGSRGLAARALLRAPIVSLAVVGVAWVGAGPTRAEGVFTVLTPPAVTGNLVEGETLGIKRGTWSSPPASTSEQWQRCNSKGDGCESIEKAMGQSYRLTAADVGHTIRVSENATNSAGATTPTVSEPTAVVQARAGGQQGGGSGGGGSGGNGGSGGGGGGSGSPGGSPPTRTHVDAAQLEGLLTHQLAPTGRSASIAALLAHGGLAMRFTLKASGRLVVRWYLAQPAKRGHKAKGKPTLLASGQVRFTAAGTRTLRIGLTAAGRQLLRHASRVSVRATAVFTPTGASALSVTRTFGLAR